MEKNSNLMTGQGEDGKWITVNGSHVFVQEGQSVEDAMNTQFNKKSKQNNNAGKNKPGITIGGKTFKTSQEIDAYYDNEYKKSRDILETSNAMNRILGTSGGFTIGGKVFTTSEQLRKHYKNKAEQAKTMLNNQ